MTQDFGKKKIFAFVQTRYNSLRLPGKVCKKLVGKLSVLTVLLERLKKSKEIYKIIVLTSKKKNKEIIDLCKKSRIEYFLGSETNVLDRYFKAAIKYKAKHILRITADCPLVDISIIKKAIKIYSKNKFDYVSNVNPPTFPDGLDIELFKFHALKISWKNVNNKYQKEHPTQYIINNKIFKKKNIINKIDYSKERWTLDTKEDLILLKFIFSYFKPNIFFSWKSVLKLMKRNRSKFYINNKYKRNFGMKNNKI